jgi:hypothetical protein
MGFAVWKHELIELGDHPTFEDAPKDGSTHTTEDATEEENVDVVGQESGA